MTISGDMEQGILSVRSDAGSVTGTSKSGTCSMPGMLPFSGLMIDHREGSLYETVSALWIL